MKGGAGFWGTAGVGAVVALLLHLAFGGVFSLAEVWGALLAGPGNSPEQTVLWQIRLPRAFGAMLVGANLAVVGGAFQALFRNPLADPFIIGVSSAAAVGGAFASLLGLATLAVMGMSFVTAVLGLLLVLSFGKGRGVLSLSYLLIAGAAIGSFLWALVTFLLAQAGQDSGKILDWLLGSLVGIDWMRTSAMACVFALGLALLYVHARGLTVFTVGEESARTLGVEVERLKWVVLLTGTAMAAATVSSVGIVGFVGLFTPHIARRMVGTDMRRVLGACAILGAISVLLADLIAQKCLPEGLNLGVVTALIGAPFLITLLRSKL